MLLTCPCCHARFPPESALMDEAARRAVAAALRLPPPLGDLLLRYLGCFRPNKSALAWDRAARLLTELLELIHTAEVTRNDITRAAPLDTWRHALEATLEARDAGTLELPLKNGHAYLTEIAWRESGRRHGKQEQRTEQRKRNPAHRSSTGGLKKAATLVRTPEQKQTGKDASKALQTAIEGAKK